MNKTTEKYLSEANSDLQWLIENLEGLETLLTEMQDAAQCETVSIKNLIAIKTLTEDCFTRARRAHENVERVIEDIETATILNDD